MINFLPTWSTSQIADHIFSILLVNEPILKF